MNTEHWQCKSHPIRWKDNNCLNWICMLHIQIEVIWWWWRRRWWWWWWNIYLNIFIWIIIIITLLLLYYSYKTLIITILVFLMQKFEFEDIHEWFSMNFCTIQFHAPWNGMERNVSFQTVPKDNLIDNSFTVSPREILHVIKSESDVLAFH